MRQLSDILIERKAKFGGWAEIGRLLGGIDGQLIGKYAAGKVIPALDFAIEWKKAFNENLIDLMFAEEKQAMVSEPTEGYVTAQELIVILKDLTDCQKENKKLLIENEELRKLNPKNI